MTGWNVTHNRVFCSHCMFQVHQRQKTDSPADDRSVEPRRWVQANAVPGYLSRRRSRTLPLSGSSTNPKTLTAFQGSLLSDAKLIAEPSDIFHPSILSFFSFCRFFFFLLLTVWVLFLLSCSKVYGLWGGCAGRTGSRPRLGGGPGKFKGISVGLNCCPHAS